MTTMTGVATVPQARMTDPQLVLNFITGGNAIFTLRSNGTGTRYTYKVSAGKKSGIFFVAVLTGSDNLSDYTYIGMLSMRRNVLTFSLTGKSKMTADSLPVKAISWAVLAFQQGKVPQTLEVWHEGRCGRCGRMLTVPESIESGFGPDCATMVEPRFAPMPIPVVLPRVPAPAKARMKPVTSEELRADATPVSVVSPLDVEQMIATQREQNPESYYMDGELTEEQAHQFWSKRFSSLPLGS